MNNTDSFIKNITGSNNYIKELEKVCGNMETINKDWFVNQNNENIVDDELIRKTLLTTLGKDVDEVRQYFALSMKTCFVNPFRTVIKKSHKTKSRKTKTEIRDDLKPKVFIKSDYFKLLKRLEKQTNNLIESFGRDGDKLDNILKTQPDLIDVKTFYGYKIKQPTDIKPVVVIHDCAHNIISRYMLPMYDIKNTMNKNWGMLAPLFKNSGNLSVGEFELNQHDIKDMLYLFMVAKYRCTITENNKYYVKLFMNIINNNGTMEEETEFGKMDPARFLELLDTINLEAIDKKQKVYKFAEQSKSIIKRIINKQDGDNMEDIMKDILNMVNDNQTPGAASLAESTVEETLENTDILDNVV